MLEPDILLNSLKPKNSTLNDIHLLTLEIKRRTRYCNKTNQVHSCNSQLIAETIPSHTTTDGIKNNSYSRS